MTPPTKEEVAREITRKLLFAYDSMNAFPFSDCHKLILEAIESEGRELEKQLDIANQQLRSKGMVCPLCAEAMQHGYYDSAQRAISEAKEYAEQLFKKHQALLASQIQVERMRKILEQAISVFDFDGENGDTKLGWEDRAESSVQSMKLVLSTSPTDILEKIKGAADKIDKFLNFESKGSVEEVKEALTILKGLGI